MQFALRTRSVGPEHRIYFLVSDGKCRCDEFLGSLAETSPDDFDRTVAVMDRIAEKGLMVNTEVFRTLRDGLHEIAVGTVRIVVFVDGARVICTHGFLKRSQKTLIGEINLGRHLRASFLVAMQKGDTVEIEE